jgi:hypothetical protein
VIEHHRAGPDLPDRVGDAAAGMSDAEPCTGSNIDGYLRSGLMFLRILGCAPCSRNSKSARPISRYANCRPSTHELNRENEVRNWH